MALRLGTIFEDRLVKLTVELPAALHRDLLRYAQIHADEQGLGLALPPERLIAPMLECFMDSDRGFTRHRSEK
jgi:hypothetical protein